MKATDIEKQMKHMLGYGIDNFTPAELARLFVDLAATADRQVTITTAQGLEYVVCS